MKKTLFKIWYINFKSKGLFLVVVVETMGPWCKDGTDWLNKLGQKIVETTEDIKATQFLMQRTSMAS